MKQTNILLTGLLVVAILCMAMPVGATPGTTVSIGSTTSSSCDTVSIMIDTDDVDGIGAATIVSDGDLGTVTSYSATSGTVTMVAYSATACPTGSVKFADIEFCPAGSGCSNLDIEVTELNDCNVDAITPDAVTDGQFCVSGTSTADTTVSIGSTASTSCDTVSIMINTNDVVSDGDLGTVTSYSATSGTVTMVAYSATACPTGSVKFADLEFCPVALSGCSDLDIEVTELNDCNVEGITPDTVTDGQFCIQPPPPEGGGIIDLNAGWNFISVPRNLNDSSTAEVLKSIESECDAIWWYNAADRNWYVPTDIIPLTAYWIHMNTSQILYVEYGPGTIPSMPMYVGCNPIGLTGSGPRDAEFTLSLGVIGNNIDDYYSVVWGPWDPEKGYLQYGFNEDVYDPLDGTQSSEYVYTTEYIMDEFEGHWVYMTENAILWASG